jgi:tRNA-2-methylthio-N6-dimethylallyladenosine synthase
MENLISEIGIINEQEAACETVRTTIENSSGKQRKLYIESYGCQMNFSDSEIVASILNQSGFDTTSDINSADVVFLNTCSIRDKAEQTVRNRLAHINGLKKHKPGPARRRAGLHGRAA